MKGRMCGLWREERGRERERGKVSEEKEREGSGGKVLEV